jgi:hypothetical protein
MRIKYDFVILSRFSFFISVIYEGGNYGFIG